MSTLLTIASQENLRYCQFCKKDTHVVLQKDEYVCGICGWVHKNKVDWVYSKYSDNPNNGSTTSYTSSEPSLKGYSYTRKDYTGHYVNSALANSLGKTYQKTKITSPLTRSKYRGLAEIDRLVKLLDIPPFLQTKIVDKFLDFNKRGLLRSRNMYSCTVALIVIIANIHDVPIAISEVLKNTSVSRKKFNKEYFYLYYLFDKAEPNSAKGERHLEKFLSYIKPWSHEAKFKQSLKQALNVVNFESLHGRDAIVSAGAILLYLLKYYKYPETEVFLKDLVINRLTLKNSWNTLYNKYPFFKKFGYQE